MSIYDNSGWSELVHAHDHVWADRTKSIKDRIETCLLLHKLSLLCELEIWNKREAELGHRCSLGLSEEPKQ